MDTSNSKQSNLNMTEKTDKDGKATDTIERKTLKNPEQNTDINTFTDHFCRNVLNNGGRQAQEENHLSSSAVNFHVVDPPAIRNVGNLARTIDQSDNEFRLHNEGQDFPKPVQNIDDFKALSDQPVDIDLDMDIPKHNPKCKSFPNDIQENIQRKYETITDNTNNSQVYEIVTTKPELGVNSRVESNNQMHLSETELGNLGVDISLPETEEDYLINEYRHIEDQSNGYDHTEYHRNGYHLTEYQRNGYHFTEYLWNGYHLTEYHWNGYQLTGYQRNGYHLTGYHWNGYHLTEYHWNGYHLTEYHWNGYHLTEYHWNGYHLTEYQRNGYHLTEYHWNGYHQTEYHWNGYHLTEYHWNGYHLTEYHWNGYHLTEYHRNEYHQTAYHRNRYHLTEYHSNGYHQTEYYSSLRHELFMNFNCQQNFRPDSLSLTSQAKDYLCYIGWYYKNLKDTLSLKTRVYEYFEEYSNSQFQYSFADKMHINQYYLKHTDKFLFEQYQCNVIVYAVVRVEPEYGTLNSPVNDIDPQGLTTTYYESEEDDHEHNGLTSHAQAAHAQEAHAHAAHAQAAHAQAAHAGVLNMTARRVHTTTEDNMTAETTHSPAITLSITDRGIQCNGTRETYALNTRTVQSTENTMNIIARGVQCTCTREPYSLTAGTAHSTANRMNIAARVVLCTGTRVPYNITARMVQRTASTTSMNTSVTSSQYSSTRGTYRMAAETVQVTANTTSMNTSVTSSQYSSTRGMYIMAAETVQVTANTTSMNTSATGSQYSSTRGRYRMAAETVQVNCSANTTTMNTSATGSQYINSRGMYRMADGTVQRTANMMNVSVRSEQRAQEAYSMTAASGHCIYGACSMSIGTVLRTSGSSTHIISSNSSANARFVNNTSATMQHIQETRNSTPGRGNQASRVIESDPVRIEDQPLGANHLADLIQQHIHQNGSQLQRTPLAGQDRPDMCSPDTVTTVLTSAVLQNQSILDYFRTMGATGAQVLEIVRNYLQHNYGSVTADIRQMVLEKHGDVGDIHSEVHVISAIIGDTKIKIMTTCSNQDCQVINSRMIESSLIIKYQGVLTSTFVNHYLNHHLLGNAEPCSNCSNCQRIPLGIKRTVRSIESTFIYINASQGRVPKANVKDMLSQFCVGESHYQVHALSFWHDQHFTVRINIHNMWWTYDNKRGIFNQGVEVDDCMPGLLSGIYIKKIA